MEINRKETSSSLLIDLKLIIEKQNVIMTIQTNLKPQTSNLKCRRLRSASRPAKPRRDLKLIHLFQTSRHPYLHAFDLPMEIPFAKGSNPFRLHSKCV